MPQIAQGGKVPGTQTQSETPVAAKWQLTVLPLSAHMPTAKQDCPNHMPEEKHSHTAWKN